MADSININDKPKDTQRIMLGMTAWICGGDQGLKFMFLSYYK